MPATGPTTAPAIQALLDEAAAVGLGVGVGVPVPVALVVTLAELLLGVAPAEADVLAEVVEVELITLVSR